MKKLLIFLTLFLMLGVNAYAITSWVCFKDNQSLKFSFDDAYIYVHFNDQNKTIDKHKITEKTDRFLSAQWERAKVKDEIKIDLINNNVSWTGTSEFYKFVTLKIYDQCKIK